MFTSKSSVDKTMPNNLGNTSKEFINRYFLEFGDIDGRPTYELTKKLTIGSESGEVLLEESGISPRHCTISLENDVLMVLDHGSQKGTYINNKKISPGKSFIFDQRDKLKLGDISVEVGTSKKVRPIPDVPEETQIMGKSKNVSPSYEEEDLELNIGPEVIKGPKAENKEASNSFLRIVAILEDLVFSFIILSFSKFNPLADIDLIPQIEKVFTPLERSMPAFKSLGLKLVEKADILGVIISTFIIFAAFRVITTLIFGVSLGQLLVGLKGQGSSAKKRILGALRETFGLFTWPVLIFDAPSLFSSRTFKEIISFSRVQTRGFFSATFLTLFSTSTILFSIVGYPLFLNMDELHRTPVVVEKSLMKEKMLNNWAAGKYFPFELNSEDLTHIIQLKDGPLIDHVYVESFNKSGAQLGIIKREKNFSVPDLINSSVQNNVLSSYSFPYLTTNLNDISALNKNFIKSFDNTSYTKEIVSLTKVSLDLSLDTLKAHTKKYGPFYNGFIEYKKFFKGIIKEKLLKVEARFVDKKGLFVFFTDNPKVMYLMPILNEVGQLYKVTAEKPLGLINKLSYKVDGNSKSYPTINSIFDENTSEENVQAYYNELWEIGKRVMSLNNKTVTESFQRSLSAQLNFVKIVNKKKETSARIKFERNIIDMLSAIKLNTHQFFGIKKIITI